MKMKLKSRTILIMLSIFLQGLVPMLIFGQASEYPYLEFFYNSLGDEETIPEGWNGKILEYWNVSVKPEERQALTGHLDIPAQYHGYDQTGDWLDGPVLVIWDFIGTNISTVTIPDGIKLILRYAFHNCSKLESVVIPNSVDKVGDQAFRGCSLNSVVVSPNNDCFASFSGNPIKKGAYPEGKRAFVADIEVPYPTECIPTSEGLIFSPDNTSFYFAPWMTTKLELPNTVTFIGSKALAGCTKLKTLSVKSITPPSVSEDTFEGANISLIEVPKGCKELYTNDKSWSMFASVIKEVNTALILNQTVARLKSSESLQLTASIENPSSFEGKIVWASSDEAVATVDSNGLIRARAVGKTVIRATYENLSAECEVTVEPTGVTSIELSSTKETLKVKQNILLHASVYPETATDKTVVWSSSNEEIATVDKTGRVYARSLGNVIITAACGGVKATCEIDVIETLPERVSIDWKCDKLEVNNTFQLRASVYPETTTDQTLIWSSSDNAVATVDESGLVTAHSVGTVIITATCGNVSGQHTINVVSVPPSYITLNLTSAELKGIDKVQLNATILPTEASGLPVTWTSSDENIVTVDETGLVTSIKPGNAVVTASCESVKATCNIVVREVTVSSISLNYSNVILKRGETLQLIAEVYPENANDKRVLWSSSDINVVTVEPDGKLTAVGVGEAYLAISCNGVIKFCDVTVIDEDGVRIILNETDISLGASQSFQLKPTSVPELTSSQTFMWSSSNESVATVNETGLVTAVSVGETSITATCGKASATCNVTVKPILATSITLDKETLELTIGKNETLKATVEPENTTDKTIVWSSSDEDIAIVSEEGVVTAVSFGTTTITATYEGKAAICTVTVIYGSAFIEPFIYDGINYSIHKDSGTASVSDNSNLIRENLVIPDYIIYQGQKYQVTEIEDYAFCFKDKRGDISKNLGLTGSLTIGEAIRTIGRFAFCYCSCFTGSLKIPNSVRSIGNNAFNYCTGFTGSLEIPNSVITIGVGAFNDCTGFNGTLTLSNSLTQIGHGAFNNCRGFIGSLIIPKSLTYIATQTFSDCSGLSGTLTIPNTITEIGYNAFQNCSGFTGSLSIPQSVTYVGGYAFSGCSGFSGTLSIPSSITEIGPYTFSGCSGFTGELTIHNTVEHIYDGAFKGCSGLETLYLHPLKIESIDGSAFHDTKFKDIYCDAIEPLNIGSQPFSDWDYEFSILHFPVEGLGAYRNHYRWIKFRNFKPIGELVNNILLDEEEIQVTINQNYRINATLTPQDAVNKLIIWITDAENVATVSEDGVVTAISVGTATITAKCGEVSATCKVTVNPVMATSVVLDKESMELVIGENKTLTATVEPENTTDKTIVWSSSNEEVAAVSEDGVVTAISVGTATITAKCGEVSAICNVTVKPILATSIILNKETLELVIGENETLAAAIDPESTTDKTIAWSSSDENVATVSHDGVVTAVSVGETTITATCGEATATCEVIVKPIVPTSITLNTETLELTIGENEILTATVDPESTTDKTIVWSSSDENVATVSGDGVVTAVSVGETTITATCGEATATCEITVSPCLVESIELDYSKWNGFPGESFTISATVNPYNAIDKTIIWNSSDPEVATVDETGMVIAVKPGSSLITAITSNGLTGSCEVTVLPILVESITLDPNIIQGIIGELFVIKASVLPEDASNPNIYWESGNTNVVTVDQNGNVKINGEGSSRIFAYATDGSNVSGECFILGTSGIESILTECGYHISIYTPSGLLIKKDCTLEDLKNLVPGIYIFKSEKKTVSVMIH